MASVTFQTGSVSVGKIYFDDLDLNDSFRVDSRRSRGAVYRKVLLNESDEFQMLEEATGKVFLPTQSPVSKVKVTVTIDAVKPNIY